jgi:hypothetical protein
MSPALIAQILRRSSTASLAKLVKEEVSIQNKGIMEKLQEISVSEKTVLIFRLLSIPFMIGSTMSDLF